MACSLSDLVVSLTSYISFSSAVILSPPPPPVAGAGPDRYCLACLCQAATGCDLYSGCTAQGSATLCGPFYMSRPFWQDANTTAEDSFRHFG